ncbi:MAG: MFS transporter, partial [Gammaproteobacteria bacterium]
MLTALRQLPENIRQYLIITGNYWAFTLTDGALRMLVVLYFHELGYTPIAIASLFLFYEFFGVLTNLFGGWLGAK